MGILARITRIHVLAVGCVFFIGVGLAFMMLVIQPRLRDLRSTRQQVNAQKSEADKLPGKLRDLAEAQAIFVDTKAKFDAILAKQPPLTTTDGNQTAFDLWREYGPGPTSSGTVLWNWFASRGYNVSGITVPGPPPPPVSLPPIISWNMGLSLRARNFGQVMNLLRSTQSIPRLMLISGISGISGHPPDLQVPLPATVFIFTRNAPGVAAPGPVAAGGLGGVAPPTSTSEDN